MMPKGKGINKPRMFPDHLFWFHEISFTNTSKKGNIEAQFFHLTELAEDILRKKMAICKSKNYL